MYIAVSGLRTIKGYVLATKKTPALTMVAACINADTVVGPSIASGSQKCNGNWADLPTAPPKIHKDAHFTASAFSAIAKSG